MAINIDKDEMDREIQAFQIFISKIENSGSSLEPFVKVTNIPYFGETLSLQNANEKIDAFESVGSKLNLGKDVYEKAHTLITSGKYRKNNLDNFNEESVIYLKNALEIIYISYSKLLICGFSNAVKIALFRDLNFIGWSLDCEISVHSLAVNHLREFSQNLRAFKLNLSPQERHYWNNGTYLGLADPQEMAFKFLAQLSEMHRK